MGFNSGFKGLKVDARTAVGYLATHTHTHTRPGSTRVKCRTVFALTLTALDGPVDLTTCTTLPDLQAISLSSRIRHESCQHARILTAMSLFL
jgi:hypothetical protein